MIEKQAFRRYHENKVRDSFTMNLNEEEREILEKCKLLIQQDKDSTAMKQLALIGAKEIQSPKTSAILDIVFNNKRKNKRTGIDAIMD
jgi:hypothetical protein